jgi:transposase
VLILSSWMRVFVARQAMDFRQGIDGLAGHVREVFGEDPLCGAWFVFTNKRANRLRILVWDKNGFWLLTKRLERGTFERFEGAGAKLEIDRAKLAMLIDGIDVKKARSRRNFRREIRIQSREDDQARRSPAS